MKCKDVPVGCFFKDQQAIREGDTIFLKLAPITSFNALNCGTVVPANVDPEEEVELVNGRKRFCMFSRC